MLFHAFQLSRDLVKQFYQATAEKMLEDMSMFLIWLTHYDSKSIQSSFSQKHSIILFKTM